MCSYSKPPLVLAFCIKASSTSLFPFFRQKLLNTSTTEFNSVGNLWRSYSCSYTSKDPWNLSSELWRQKERSIDSLYFPFEALAETEGLEILEHFKLRHQTDVQAEGGFKRLQILKTHLTVFSWEVQTIHKSKNAISTLSVWKRVHEPRCLLLCQNAWKKWGKKGLVVARGFGDSSPPWQRKPVGKRISMVWNMRKLLLLANREAEITPGIKYLVDLPLSVLLPLGWYYILWFCNLPSVITGRGPSV